MRSARLLAAFGAGYVLGTVPSADLAARLATQGRSDVRGAGTGNPGGLNAVRVLGRVPGRAVIAADIAKGVVACAGGRRLAGDAGAHIAGVGAVAGHCYPLWSGFRGGKGVATSFGQCVYTMPTYAPFDIALATAAARLPGLRRPALGSVAVSALAWVLAGVLWSRRDVRAFWAPAPGRLLPLANAASTLVIASRAAAMLGRGEPDELALPR
jgi:glycerol-3-phosphate acyltransferase PlsY